MKIAICLMFLISCGILLIGIDSHADSHQKAEMEKADTASRLVSQRGSCTALRCARE